ncbi:MAG: apolipoprotein N-acyltransferase [Mucinivorans sp.]
MNFLKRPIFLSLLSALLLSLPWLGAGPWWVLVAFVPLLWLQKSFQSQARRGFLWWVALSLFVWIALCCFWVSLAFAAASFIVPMVGVASLWPAWWLYNIVSKRSTRALSYVVLIAGWIAAEWWYSMGDVSFPWLTLGGAWAQWPWAVQWYSATGIYGGTLWILVANVAIYTALTRRRVWFFAAAWVAIPLGLSLTMYWSYQEPRQTIQVAAIQPNIDPYTEKYATDGLRSVLSLAADAPQGVELFVAPDTVITSAIDLDNIAQSASIAQLQLFLREKAPDAAFVIGASAYSKETFYNVSLYVDTLGVQVYRKSKLVIGVETTPDWVADFAGAIDMGGYVGSLGRQKEREVFRGPHPLGAAICYESIYGQYFAQWSARGAQIMAVITNDGWWGDTPGYRHHFAYARLRAVENRRSIVRAANTGISALIGPKGEIRESLPWDRRGIITGALPLNTATTPYTVWGDLTARLAIYVLALSLLFFVGERFRRKV